MGSTSCRRDARGEDAATSGTCVCSQSLLKRRTCTSSQKYQMANSLRLYGTHPSRGGGAVLDPCVNR